jgi:hypothetical protein
MGLAAAGGTSAILTGSIDAIGFGAGLRLSSKSGNSATDTDAKAPLKAGTSSRLPATDCTNAMVCAINASRSFFQLMTHLSPAKGLPEWVENQLPCHQPSWNSAGFA